MSPPRIYVSAGEPSGDQHGAALARALAAVAPDAVLEGMGGAGMADAGVRLLCRSDAISARGLLEAARHLPAHVRALRRLEDRFARDPYDLVVLIDYPGFHFRVAAAARRASIPVLYYVAPQLWAWGAWRAARLRQVADRMAVILPFEERFFRERGIRARYVGHPLLDRGPMPDRGRARAALGIPAGATVLGLFPGSRPDDIRRHWPAFRDAARRVRRTRPDLRVLLAAVSEGSYPGDHDVLATADPAAAFAAADAGLCKSGTTTLEAALAGMPHVVAYRTHPVTYLAARSLVRVPWIGLANLVAERALSPELIQGHATPEALARAVAPLLDPARPDGEAQRRGFAEVRTRLGSPGASRRVAAWILELAA